MPQPLIHAILAFGIIIQSNVTTRSGKEPEKQGEAGGALPAHPIFFGNLEWLRASLSRIEAAWRAMADQVSSQVKKKIVVVEDDEDFLTLVNMMLADENLEIIPALDGEAGLEAIRTYHPDVVILDLILPDMNGWEVFMQMRNEAESKDIPVIILTNQGTRHDRTFSLHVAQVHDYLTKPCLPSQLRHSVASALSANGEHRNRT